LLGDEIDERHEQLRTTFDIDGGQQLIEG